MKCLLYITNFSIVFLITLVISSKTNGSIIRTSWYKIESNKKFDGYMAKSLSFKNNRFEIKNIVYDYKGSAVSTYELTSVSDKLFNPIYYEYKIKEAGASEYSTNIRAEFYNNILSKTKITNNQTFTRQDVIPENTILKEFLYMVLINDNLPAKKSKTYNVLDETFDSMIPYIRPISLKTRELYNANAGQITLLKTSYGYTQIDKLGKVIFESEFNRSIRLIRNFNITTAMNFFKTI